MKKYKPNEIQETYPIDTPCTKMMYKSESEARAAILFLKDVKGITGLTTYYCTKCGYHHLTRNFD